MLIPEDMFPNLAKALIFTKIDLTRGYWQIKMDVASKPYTAFSRLLGILQFCRLAFGLVSAPSNFTKHIRKLTFGHKDTVSYLDDILIFHITISDHIEGVNSLLESIRKFGLTIRPKKTFVAMNELTFLDYFIKQGQLMPKPSLFGNILAIQEWQVQSILGLVNFYGSFIPHFSDIVTCLSELAAGKMTNNSI